LADKISAVARSRNMSRIRSKDMKPEMAVRRQLHALGYRFRLHRRDLPGKPDIVFLSRRKVIFVNGCFWHQHAAPDCKDSRLPRSNVQYWQEKLAKNVQRDKRNIDVLQNEGWSVLTVWECEVDNCNDELVGRLKEFLGLPRNKPRKSGRA